jgi:serine/threonine-protein kinase
MKLEDGTPALPPTLTAGEPDVPGNNELRPGQVLGEHQIQRVIGRGGMGTVYEAIQPTVEARVAIKVLGRQLTPRAVERFINEGRLANRVRHPGIVRIFSHGRLPDGGHYLVMEFLEGITLHKLAHLRPLAPAEGLGILRSVAEALDAAHGERVVHRDLKPSNIMILQPEGDLADRPAIKLLDFGISKLLAPDQRLALITGEGTAMGTPAYTAPEQSRGEKVDHRADIYSLGAIAYELLTGQRPYRVDSLAELVLAQQQRDPTPASRINPRLGRAVDQALSRAFHRNPRQRPPTAIAFIDELTEAQGLSLPVQPPSARRALPVPGPRTPPTQALLPLPGVASRHWIWIGALVLFVAGGGLLLTALGSGRRAQPSPAARSPRAASTAPPVSPGAHSPPIVASQRSTPDARQVVAAPPPDRVAPPGQPSTPTLTKRPPRKPRPAKTSVKPGKAVLFH